jgi:hypothetical protein
VKRLELISNETSLFTVQRRLQVQGLPVGDYGDYSWLQCRLVIVGQMVEQESTRWQYVHNVSVFDRVYEP